MTQSRTRKIGRVLSALVAGAFLALPGGAWGAPPVNDDYLQSIRIVDSAGRVPTGNVRDVRDTTDATVQPDLFAPEAVGGGVEPSVTPTVCGSVGYGRTLWYDFTVRTAGAVELRASGPENVLVLYEFNPVTSVLGTEVACTGPAGGTDLVQAVKAGKSYTVQVGGVDRGLGPAGGPLTFGFELFADSDDDGVLDDLDKCPAYAGRQRFGGCPATVEARTSVNQTSDGGGRLALTPLIVRGPERTRVSVRCHRRCLGHWSTQIGSSRQWTLNALKEVRVVAGSEIDVYLTQRGLFGRFVRYAVTAKGLHTIHRCLLPVADPKPRMRCAGSPAAS